MWYSVILPILQQRLAKQQELQQQGAISSERVLQAEQEYRQTHQNISDAQAQLQQLRVQETELQQGDVVYSFPERIWR